MAMSLKDACAIDALDRRAGTAWFVDQQCHRALEENTARRRDQEGTLQSPSEQVSIFRQHMWSVAQYVGDKKIRVMRQLLQLMSHAVFQDIIQLQTPRRFLVRPAQKPPHKCPERAREELSQFKAQVEALAAGADVSWETVSKRVI